MKKILLCIFVFMAMLLVSTATSFAMWPSTGGEPMLDSVNVEWPPQHIKTDFDVDYIGYTIHDPGRLASNLSGLTMKNSNNGKCGNCHMNLSIDNVPEPKQRSPDMMKGNTI